MKKLHVLIAATGLALTVLQNEARAGDYRLGPQDELEIRVSDLRSGTGEAYQWTAFNGTFRVGASGKLALPMLGEIKAGGTTTADLAQTIENQLQAKVGLAKKPDASVQITKYRPIYVTGAVEKPGDYEYRPGLTVLQATSLAGGLAKVTSDVLLTYARDALATRGDLRVLEADRVTAIVREARLDAEIKNERTITLPKDIQTRLDDPDVARLVREEQLLFDSRRSALESQVAALKQSQDFLTKQIASLQQKEATLARQVGLNQKELDQIATLVTQGIAVVPRQLAIEQIIGQFESDRLDATTALLHAQQDFSKAGRDILDLENNRRTDILQESTEVRKTLAEILEKIDTARTLITQAEVRAPMVISEANGALRSPTYSLTRKIDDKVETRPAQESDEVEPGDVVRIETRPPSALPTGGAAEGVQG